MALLDRENVVTIPGSAFGAEGFLRLTFVAPIDQVRTALTRIGAVLRDPSRLAPPPTHRLSEAKMAPAPALPRAFYLLAAPCSRYSWRRSGPSRWRGARVPSDDRASRGRHAGPSGPADSAAGIGPSRICMTTSEPSCAAGLSLWRWVRRPSLSGRAADARLGAVAGPGLSPAGRRGLELLAACSSPRGPPRRCASWMPA